jgi:RNA polymerase sigma-70 factor (ECF subfamily)
MSVRTDEGKIGAATAELEGVPAGAAAAARAQAFRESIHSEAAFRAFYERALPRVFGYLYHRCHGDRVLAEDLTQAAFTEAIRHAGSYDGRSDPVVWLIGISRHKLLDEFRARARDEQRSMRLHVRELVLDDGEQPWRAADDRSMLQAALGRLPAMQQAVLILRYADGLPVREIARELHRSESATESLLGRARTALREAWEEVGHD